MLIYTFHFWTVCDILYLVILLRESVWCAAVTVFAVFRWSDPVFSGKSKNDAEEACGTLPYHGTGDTENAEQPIFQMMLDAWLKARRKLESGECTIDQYHEWMYWYPESFETESEEA